MVDMVYSTAIILLILFYHERGAICRKNSKNPLKLAWNLLSKTCAKLFEFLQQILRSPEFVSRHRESDRDFVRNRKLPFHLLIVFILSLLRGSYQDELDRFFKILLRLDVAKRFVTNAALCKARLKLKHEAFIELNLRLIHFVEKHFNLNAWMGFRLLAVDGSTVRLPRVGDIPKHFGQWGVRRGRPSPMARISQLYDVLNGLTVDAVISPKKHGERDLAVLHFLKLSPTDLILLDRGYPAWWLFSAILSSGANFCARISCKKWKIVRTFFESGKKESVLYFPPSNTSIKPALQMALPLTPLKLRLIRIENDGKTQVLITSLTDCSEHPFEVFSDLYHKRWPVEEDYKVVKARLELENFSGRSVQSVYQDFHAKILIKNLVATLCHPVNEALVAQDAGRAYDYKTNFTSAISKSKDALALLFNRPMRKIHRLVQELQDVFLTTIEPIRPGRKYPRGIVAPGRKCFQNYKPVA
jgi:hypothetical protein